MQSSVGVVKHSLFYYRSGVKKEPNPRDPLSHFSHANWADRQETCVNEWGDTVKKTIPLTSFIKNLVDQLDQKRWDKINAEALPKGPPESPSPPLSCDYEENPQLIDDSDDSQDDSDIEEDGDS
ncbi:hypothetical protein PTI98_011843 [Pleurotus ostreatus]|nr:hypothetical protein PTI98_011843 [Pleurotus ostreatus]